MFTKKLKPKELHGVLEELLAFFEMLSLDEQEICKSKVQVYSDVANRLSAWSETFLTDKLVLLENADIWDIWYTGASPFPAKIGQPVHVTLYSKFFLAHKSIHSRVFVIWFTSTL